MPDRLDQIWDIQFEQQQLWHTWLALSDLDRAQLSKDLMAHLHEQVGQLQRKLDVNRYHLVKSPVRLSIPDVADTGISVFKLLVALMHLHGVKPDEFMSAFLRVTDTVRAKAEWENADLAGTDVLLCDIDGCVALWHTVFEKWAVAQGFKVEPGKLNAPELESAKDAFHASGGFRDLDQYPGAVAVLNAWRNAKPDKRRLIMGTARPYRRHQRIYGDTVWWLKQAGLKYDHVLFEHDKAELVRKVQPASIVAHIEDRGKHALEVAATGVQVLKLPHEGATEEDVRHPRIHHVSDWDVIAWHLGLSVKEPQARIVLR